MSGTKPGKAAHYRGDWARKSAALRRAYYANPDTRCEMPNCGMTYDEYREIYGERAAAWQVDHVRPGDPTSPLRPAHQRCNASAGAIHGNRLRMPSSGWV